ncbi:hypothetical protein [Nitriliruptor alkaliphilus]|uniref:hypothetical protein n=1 Tax=Nitriliruptor alkaliphilus TaxID=427918 RepID=UPI0012EDB4C8|nr:hypothetical protein [Nitriliruptor alkaliphilus]
MREVHHAKGVASVKGILVGSLLVLASAPGVAAQESDPTDDEEPRSPCSGFATACGGAVIEREGVQLEVRVPDDVEGLVEFARVHPPRPCTYRAVPPSFDPQVDVAITAGVPAGAVYFIRDCGDGEQWRWYVPGSPFTNDENVLGMIGEAFRRLEPPVPGLVTAPPLGSEVLTGFPMYLAVDEGAFEGLSGSVSAGQFTVTAWVVPVSSRFVPGDGSEPRVCEGRGSVWSAGLRPSAWDARTRSRTRRCI